MVTVKVEEAWWEAVLGVIVRWGIERGGGRLVGGK